MCVAYKATNYALMSAFPSQRWLYDKGFVPNVPLCLNFKTPVSNHISHIVFYLGESKIQKNGNFSDLYLYHFF